MKSSRQVEQLIGCARVRTNQATDALILSEADRALVRYIKNRPQAPQPGPTIWRFIMQSRVTRYSAAAIVVLAAALVLLSPFGPSNNGSVLLAQAARNMDKVQMIVHKEDRVFYELGNDEPLLKASVTKHACPQYGVVEEQYNADGTLMHRAYVLTARRQIVGVDPGQKKYFKLPMSEAWAQLADCLTPQGLVDYFLATEYKDLGRSNVDGHEVKGFTTTDSRLWPIDDKYRLLFPVKQIVWKFWIDVETRLPVRAEYEITTDRGLFTGLKKLRVVCTVYDFDYRQDVRAEVFEPNIPADYTEMELSSLVPVKAAIGTGLGAAVLGFVVRRKLRRRKNMRTA